MSTEKTKALVQQHTNHILATNIGPNRGRSQAIRSDSRPHDVKIIGQMVRILHYLLGILMGWAPSKLS